MKILMHTCQFKTTTIGNEGIQQQGAVLEFRETFLDILQKVTKRNNEIMEQSV